MFFFLNPIAELDAPDSGELIFPDKAHQLSETHKFFCPDYDCKDPARGLFVKKSSKDNYFFSHYGDYAHNINPETLLHKSAIKWFLTQTEYEIPALGAEPTKTIILDSTKTIPEYRKLELIRPDVQLTTMDNFTFAIEIVVTSDVTGEKIKRIKEFKLPTLRVDLQEFYYENKRDCQTDLGFIQKSLSTLMIDLNLKRWVITSVNEEVEMAKPEIPSNNAAWGWLILIFIAIIAYLSGKNKKGKSNSI